MNKYNLLWPLIRRVDPERAHRCAITALSCATAFLKPKPSAPELSMSVLGLDFPNPLGLAAGFDKNAEVPDALLTLGFGFVEVGTVTPRPQVGNPRPRLFRLEKDHAIINRMGFNNHGVRAVQHRLALRLEKGRGGVVAANVGPNRGSDDAIEDCVTAARALAPFVQYLVINVSSPNTPGLRELQRANSLRDLIERVADGIADLDRPPKLLIKVAPDLDHDELADIAEIALEGKVDGLIATNTTTARPSNLRSKKREEIGGLSGPPLFERSTSVLFDLYKLTRGQVPLIGVGGINGGADAYRKIRAGASLVQLYTALVFQGPGIVGRILDELNELLKRDGFSSVQAAVGADHQGTPLETGTRRPIKA